MGVLISCLSVPHYTLSKLGPVTSSPQTQFTPLLREVPTPVPFPRPRRQEQSLTDEPPSAVLMETRQGTRYQFQDLAFRSQGPRGFGGLEIKTNLNQRHVGALLTSRGHQCLWSMSHHMLNRAPKRAFVQGFEVE